jgi:hypothetical protein
MQEAALVYKNDPSLFYRKATQINPDMFIDWFRRFQNILLRGGVKERLPGARRGPICYWPCCTRAVRVCDGRVVRLLSPVSKE